VWSPSYACPLTYTTSHLVVGPFLVESSTISCYNSSVDLTRPIVRAPELPQAPWVNALEPLTMTGLRGRVVMVDIWDFT
jgi:hypothetical protein